MRNVALLKSVAGLLTGWLMLTAPSSPTFGQDPASAATPANERAAGHSYHGEAFNEGPRQAAYLMGGTGHVSFPVTTKVPDAQKFVDQGIGQLHGFWYFEAERSFRQAAALDPDCAIAYWGMALANINNETRGRKFLTEAISRKDKASPRERLYIDALDTRYKRDGKDERSKKDRLTAYLKAMDNIVLQHPDDIEAKAFLACGLWESRSEVPIASQVAVNALLKEVFAVNPMHPCHHYVIHLWDYDHSEQALASAARGGQAGPGIAHLWHMPGHIFSKLKRYNDAIWQQEASARVDHAYMIRDRILPDEIHNYAHNNEWMVRNLLNAGRVTEAAALSRNLLELPHHPKHNKYSSQDSAQYGRTRLFQTYSDYELWELLIADSQTQYLPPTDLDAEQVKRLRHLGRAYYRLGRLDEARAQRTILEQRLGRFRDEQEVAGAKAEARARTEKKEDKQVEEATKSARRPWEEKIRVIERSLDEFQGHELLADGQAKEALAAFKKAAGMDDVFLAEIQELAGEKDEALKKLRNHVNSHEHEARPLAALIQMLWRQGQRDDAKKEFEKLRKDSDRIDLAAPVFARLAPIAGELGFGPDWRMAGELLTDIGERPALDSLGPAHWSPPSVPDWQLVDGDGKAHALASYRGKPVVVIFYLGFGCLHCAEQLQKFGPKTKDFTEAGISLVAISSDSPANLKKSHERYSGGKFPFEIVSDESLQTFKAYRAFDDFEQKPLHGTFLIDADGRLRWWDIGHEPFMDPDFVLNEARRQLQPDTLVIAPEPAYDPHHPASALDLINPRPTTPVSKTEAAGG